MRPINWFAVGPLCFSCAASCAAAEIGYKFGGMVIQSTSAPWNNEIPQFSVVSGVFVYDLDSQATHGLGNCDCAGYRQQRLNGFFARFGTLSVRADDYIVEIVNDLPQPGGNDADVVTIRFASNYDPPLEAELVVGSTPQSAGEFSVNLLANPELFSTTALPPSLSLANFHTSIGFLSDNVEGVLDITFSVNSLTQVDLLPGDYDYDNDVDLADYATWKAGYGSTGELVADGNRDARVDAGDYVVWRNALRQPMATAAATTAVGVTPEPTALAHAVLTAVVLVVQGKRFPQLGRGLYSR